MIRHTKTPATTTPPPSVREPAVADEQIAALERQMDDLELSPEERQFLRTLHQTEKQLNEAFDEAQQPGDRQAQVSRVYKQMYRPD